ILDLVRDITHLDTSKEAILKLRVHPDDLDLVDQYLQHDIGVSHWRLLADASIERGGCLAETVLGNIDATLQTRWERVTSALGQTSIAATNSGCPQAPICFPLQPLAGWPGWRPVRGGSRRRSPGMSVGVSHGQLAWCWKQQACAWPLAPPAR